MPPQSAVVASLANVTQRYGLGMVSVVCLAAAFVLYSRKP